MFQCYGEPLRAGPPVGAREHGAQRSVGATYVVNTRVWRRFLLTHVQQMEDFPVTILIIRNNRKNGDRPAAGGPPQASKTKGAVRLTGGCT